MTIYLFLLLGLVFCSTSAEKCAVCEDESCEQPELKTCTSNDPNNPTPPPKYTTTTTSTTSRSTTTTASTTPITTTTEEGSGSGDGGGGANDAVPIIVDGVWNDREGFLFPFEVKENIPKEELIRELPTARDLPFDLYSCLHVEFKKPPSDVTHVQQYCVSVTQKEEICDIYEEAVGEENVIRCSLSSPSSAVSNGLQSAFGIVLLAIATKIFI